MPGALQFSSDLPQSGKNDDNRFVRHLKLRTPPRAGAIPQFQTSFEEPPVVPIFRGKFLNFNGIFSLLSCDRLRGDPPDRVTAESARTQERRLGGLVVRRLWLQPFPNPYSNIFTGVRFWD